MKKLSSAILLLLVFILSSPFSRATTVSIDVQDFFFSPDLITASVGDTIHFHWMGGSHTTTSDTVPVGAAMWSSPMNSTSTDFFYPLTVAGHYHFFCQIHGQMMDGMIEATGTLGTFDPAENSSPAISFSVVSPSFVSVHYHLQHATAVYFSVHNVIGNRVQLLENKLAAAGDYEVQYHMEAGLPKGIYFLNLQAGDLKVSKEMIRQ